MADNDKAFLGVGWAFPVGITAAGESTLVAYEDDIRQAVRIILATEPGERVMRPDFGAGLRALVFEPITAATQALAQHRVQTALATWEPRIDSVDVRVDADPPNGRLMINIRYRIRASNTFYNVVYPFYLMEGETS